MEATTGSRLPGSIFFLLIVYGAIQGRFYSTKLPAFVATHFAAGGRPNGWQTHAAFYYTELFAVALATLLGFGVPALVAVLPVSLVNIPNKEYWFAPERRGNTLAYFRMSFAWFGCGLLAFLIFVNELVFRANLQTPRQLNTTAFVTALFIFLGFTAMWTIRLMVKFARPAA
jgi:uncharacterized membrane protein